jgi:hypothetical protein
MPVDFISATHTTPSTEATGGTDAEQRREGDYLSKSERYERSDELVRQELAHRGAELAGRR